jgi:glycosyltransferase involved in cell wall biosynthesis
MPSPSLTYITTCKGRLDHLRQTLPRVAAQPGVNIVVVDYDCPQQSGRWVSENFPEARVVRIENEPGFNVAIARNAGGHSAVTPWLAFFDADILIGDGFFDAVTGSLVPGRFYRPSPVTWQTWGSVICERDAFLKVDGYDTAYEGWGGEDDDFYTLLEFAGIKAGSVDGRALSEISHTDEMRTRFHSEGKKRSHQRNQIYRMAKFDVMRLVRGFMPLSLRQQVYAQIKEKLDALHERRKPEVDIEILLPKATIEFPVTEEAAGQRAFTRVARKLHYSVNWDQ